MCIFVSKLLTIMDSLCAENPVFDLILGNIFVYKMCCPFWNKLMVNGDVIKKLIHNEVWKEIGHMLLISE